MTKHTKACRKKWVIKTYGFYYCPVHDSIIDWEDEFADNMFKIFANEGKTCEDCKHYDGIHHCPAFPEGIPQPFWLGLEIHKKPKYGQKNKIVFKSTIEKPKKPSCPKCGSQKLGKFQYGLPIFSAKLEKQIEKGEVILGGCCVDESNPDFKCRDCGREFKKKGSKK